MKEIIYIFKCGYFNAILDAIKNNKHKLLKLDITNEIKAKIYDLGYINGNNDFIKYIKNNL